MEGSLDSPSTRLKVTLLGMTWVEAREFDTPSSEVYSESTMSTPTKPASVTIPLTAMKLLYRSLPANTVVCEINLEALQAMNEPNTIDEMVAEARLEYAAGRTNGYTDMQALAADLHA